MHISQEFKNQAHYLNLYTNILTTYWSHRVFLIPEDTNVNTADVQKGLTLRKIQKVLVGHKTYRIGEHNHLRMLSSQVGTVSLMRSPMLQTLHGQKYVDT